jgi:hypothetical protein
MAELRHLQGLRGLKQLELRESFSAPLDDYCESLFQPPSLLLPLLEQFDYAPSNDFSDDEDQQFEEEQQQRARALAQSAWLRISARRHSGPKQSAVSLLRLFRRSRAARAHDHCRPVLPRGPTVRFRFSSYLSGRR